MKKILIALMILFAFTAASFASIGLLTAPGIGAGRLSFTLLNATNHFGEGINMDAYDPSIVDYSSAGLRATYGLTEDVDLYYTYAMDTFTRLNEWGDPTPIEAGVNSTILGVKYTVARESSDFPLELALSLGFESMIAKLQAQEPAYTY